jgi:hypothetical protein
MREPSQHVSNVTLRELEVFGHPVPLLSLRVGQPGAVRERGKLFESSAGAFVRGAALATIGEEIE